MVAASFSLVNYRFDKIELNLETVKDSESPFEIKFSPSGVFHTEKRIYELTFQFRAKHSKTSSDIISIRCKAFYFIKDAETIKDIPPFFYNNAIAILFPYVRAFVSTITLQANVLPLLLPTLNLSDLQEELKSNTKTD